MLFESQLCSLFAAAAFVAGAAAQTCDDPTFLLCTAPTTDVDILSGTSDGDITEPLSFDWSTLDDVASLPIGKRQLKPRQTTDDSVVCCNPEVDCLTLQNIPFCYDESTTEFVLPDGSYGFVGNSTYYPTDGSFIDYGHGYYSSADGSTGTFAPAAASSGPAATSNLGLFSVEAQASNTAAAPQGPIQTGANKAVSGQQPTAAMTGGGKATATSANAGPGSTGSSQPGHSGAGSSGQIAKWLGCALAAVSVSVIFAL